MEAAQYQDSGYATSNDATSISNLSRPGAVSAQSYRTTIDGGHNHSVTTSTTTTTTTTVLGGRYEGTTTTHQPSATLSAPPIAERNNIEDYHPTTIAEMPESRTPEPPIATQYPHNVLPSTEQYQRPPILKRKSDHMDWDPETLSRLDSAAPQRPYANPNFSRPSPIRESPALRPRPSADAVRRRSSHHYEGGSGNVQAFDSREALRELKRFGKESKPILRDAVRSIGDVAKELQAAGTMKMAEYDQRHAERPVQAVVTAPQHEQGHYAPTPIQTDLPNPPSVFDVPPPRSPLRTQNSRPLRERTWDSTDDRDDSQPLPPPPRHRFGSPSPHRGSVSPIVRDAEPPVQGVAGGASPRYINENGRSPQWAQSHAPPDPMYHSSPPVRIPSGLPAGYIANNRSTPGISADVQGQNPAINGDNSINGSAVGRKSGGIGGYAVSRTQGLESVAAEQGQEPEVKTKRGRMMNKLRKKRVVS
ncbi:hypothetical protein LTR78_009703 [Recurvomyces mirabilis]|uniref:Uncharacterized protein n=1 Tax=Recurvomyces mirabilis TaxID=574656 RepID=A0AAE0WHA7_9PEZI|nr:hypothetical protein LTR78_009703 [Recurvomyces mirabilis]KAK5150255.1 hypothetical protein LTS14_010231 [Recurvomyces mirabilis]